ncbi:MAG: 16S rRNA (cytidine(1402)-2'-O)-methyltransferase [Candidatus Magnetomorum sp.]|nr:16S rRNA (cytidine(1402)-2'-O)-methyltransferase [Candidatus Magnetomorum sp.]
MPLNFIFDEQSSCTYPGTLYIVATPIGHMEDITIRGLKILNQVEWIAAEDTRETQKLLKYYHIKTPLISCHDHNEIQCAEKIISRLKTGNAIALVSDAGTPTISDPGFRVVSLAIKANISVVPIPGVSAAMTALSVSGLPSDTFVFQGFLPKKAGKREKILNQLAIESRTLIFYESPRRIETLLDHLIQILGNREAMLGRELTKKYEECIRGKLSDIKTWSAEQKAVRGECTLLVSGHTLKSQENNFDLIQHIQSYLENHADRPMSQSVKDMVTMFGESRKKIYDIALQIKTKTMD